MRKLSNLHGIFFRKISFKGADALSKKEKYQPQKGALEALARLLYPAIVSYFESEEGRREFAKWQEEQGAKCSPGKKGSGILPSKQVAWRI